MRVTGGLAMNLDHPLVLCILKQYPIGVWDESSFHG